MNLSANLALLKLHLKIRQKLVLRKYDCACSNKYSKDQLSQHKLYRDGKHL